MSGKLSALALALGVLVGAMSLKTAVTTHANDAVVIANGPAPMPQKPVSARMNGPAPMPQKPVSVRMNGPAPMPQKPVSSLL